MDIDIVVSNGQFRAEVWEPETAQWKFPEPYPEAVYVEIDQWCIDILGYPARAAYHIFFFKKQSDLDWFVLRWA